MAKSEQAVKRKPMTLLQQKKAIEKSNAAFEKMTPGEKRVAIAKDALSQIKKEKYIPITGEYISFSDSIVESGSFDDITKEEKDTQLQTVFKSMPECEVCARGALFLSTCRVFNDITIGDIAKIDKSSANSLGCDSFQKHESKFFSDHQITLIETTYERDIYSKGRARLSNVEKEACLAFAEDHGSPEETLIAILQNIIKNKGDFVIPKKLLDEAKETYG